MSGSSADIYDPAFVKGVFDRCSAQYIRVSYVCSMGFTERWRKQCVADLALPMEHPVEGYDLMAGTGEVWPHLIAACPSIRRITAVDISTGMHQLAMERLHQHRAHKIDFVEDDVLASALPDASADFIVATFGLKTFSAEQHGRLAELTARVLKPGGRFAFIEASDPKGWIFRWLYLFYLRAVLPMVERLFLRGAQDFAMIGVYSSNFGNASVFAEQLRGHGLDVTYKRYFFGCATGAFGCKPAAAEVG